MIQVSAVARRMASGALLTTGLLTTAFLATFLATAPSASAQDGYPPAPVVVAPIELRTLQASREFQGDVEPVRTSTLGSEVDGLVVEYLVREGDRVEEGAVLARLRTQAVELELGSKRAELAARKQELAELENGTRAEEITQGEARERAAKSNREFREWQRESAKKLFESQQISDDELRAAASRAETAREVHAEAVAGLELLRAGPRAERIEQARARKLASESEVARLEDLLARHTIRAPFNGWVVSRRTEVGEWLSKGDPLAMIVDIDSVDVTVRVVEDQVGGMRPDQKAVVSIRALGDRTFDAKVAEIVPMGDMRTRTFPVRVRIANEVQDGTPLLKPGMSARVTLAVGTPTETLCLPKDALVLGGRSPVVYVVQEGKGGAPPTVQPVPVKVGLAVGDVCQVTGEIERGMLVVIRGNERLRPGQAVAPSPAKAAPAEQAPGTNEGAGEAGQR